MKLQWYLWMALEKKYCDSRENDIKYRKIHTKYLWRDTIPHRALSHTARGHNHAAGVWLRSCSPVAASLHTQSVSVTARSVWSRAPHCVCVYFCLSETTTQQRVSTWQWVLVWLWRQKLSEGWCCLKFQCWQLMLMCFPPWIFSIFNFLSVTSYGLHACLKRFVFPTIIPNHVGTPDLHFCPSSSWLYSSKLP